MMTPEAAIDEVLERVRAAAAGGTPLAIRGGGTRAFLGGAERGEPLPMGAVRGIVEGARVVVANDRGFFTGIARVGEAVREGVANAPSVWWTKLTSDGKNANDTTSQRETDLGHGPVFYDNLVEIRVAD